MRDGITQIPGGGLIIEGPIHTELYRLLSIRSALKLEVNTGMQLTRGRSAASVARALFTTEKPARNKATLLKQVESYIEAYCTLHGLRAPSWAEPTH